MTQSTGRRLRATVYRPERHRRRRRDAGAVRRDAIGCGCLGGGEMIARPRRPVGDQHTNAASTALHGNPRRMIARIAAQC
jgi:hypothetical protein